MGLSLLPLHPPTSAVIHALLVLALAGGPALSQAGAADFAVSELARPASASDEFGATVAAEAGQVAIGDPGANRVYVYQRQGDGLVLEAEITLDESLIPLDFTGNPRFGASLDLVLGAYCLDLSTCPGHALIIGAPAIELVDVWSRNNPSLFPEAPDPIWEPVLTFLTGEFVEDLFGDQFGQAVTLTEDHILIGAPAAEPDGQVFVFSRDGEAFVDVLGPGGSVLGKGSTNAGFGAAMAYSDGKLAIGAPQAMGSGVVQLFDAIAGNLTSVGQAQGAPGDQFGASVTMDGSFVAAGAPAAAGGAGTAAVFAFGDPDGSVFSIEGAGLSGVGSSVALAGSFLLAGGTDQGAPTAVLRDARDPAFELRLVGNLVAGANPQVFLAADRAAGRLTIALDREVLFANGMER